MNRVRQVVVAAILVATTTVPSDALAQAAASAAPAPKGFAEVRYEFGSNSLNRTPPFDVPFYLLGDAGDRARRVEALFECWKSGKPKIIEKSGPFFWQPRAISEATTEFKILIATPLNAERDCRLRLTVVSRPDAAAIEGFKATATKALSDDLWVSLPTPDQHLTTESSKAIRGKLRTLLAAAARPNALRTTGSIFDPDAPARAFDEAAVPVFNAQDNIKLFRQGNPGPPVLPGIVGYQIALRDALQSAVQIDVLKKWVASLRQAVDSDNDIKTFVTAHDGGLSLVGLLDVRDLATGRAPTAPAVATPDDDAADAAGLLPYQTNYAALVDRIQSLLSAIETARIAPSLTAGLSNQERDALLALAAGPPPAGTPFGVWRRIFIDARNLLERIARTRTQFTAREAGIGQMMNMVEIDAILNVEALITTEDFDFGTVRSNYISMDAGLTYAFLIDEVLPYVGANFYFRPVNKDAPLSRAGSFGRRFALTAGVTLKSVAKDRVRQDAFFNGALVLGAGLRITPSIRMSGGVLYFKQIDASPLKPNSTHPGIVGFVGLSLDFDIAKALLGESGLK